MRDRNASAGPHARARPYDAPTHGVTGAGSLGTDDHGAPRGERARLVRMVNTSPQDMTRHGAPHDERMRLVRE